MLCKLNYNTGELSLELYNHHEFVSCIDGVRIKAVLPAPSVTYVCSLGHEVNSNFPI